MGTGTTAALLVLALLGLAAFIICQALLPGLTRSPQSRWFLICLLGCVGLVVGLFYAAYMPEADALQRLLAVVAAIGWVHVPAAGILLIKQATHRR